MNQAIRILLFEKRLRDSNLTYKIAYRRTLYNGYEFQNGDELDQVIFNFFNDKQPTTIRWEVSEIDTENLNLSHILKTFTPKNIQLIITASLDGLNAMELDNIQMNNAIFPIQNKEVTLFYRSILDETHENWLWLPTDVRISVNANIYIQQSQTIFPFQ
jgi:hypothetical protein